MLISYRKEKNCREGIQITNGKIFFCHFKFCHNRWNGFRIIKRTLFGSICQAIMDQRISLPDRGSRGKIARELTMMRFICYFFNSGPILHVIFEKYVFEYSFKYGKKIIFFHNANCKHDNTNDDFIIFMLRLVFEDKIKLFPKGCNK